MRNVDGENLHMLSTQNQIVWVCMCACLTKDMHPCMGGHEGGCLVGGHVGGCAVSRSISARNYIQLPTPSSSEIFKHRLSPDQNSNPYPNHHHRTAYISLHSIIMLSHYSETSFFKDPSDIRSEE